MKTIYQISKDYLTVLNQLDENGGEFTPDIEQTLAISNNEIQDKSIAYVAVIKTYEANSEEIAAEIKRLNQLKKQSDNVVSNLKERLKNALILFEIDEIKTATNKINFRKSVSVNIFDETLLPNDCVIIKKEPISKTELKKRLESNEFIPGCELVTNYNLQIK